MVDEESHACAQDYTDYVASTFENIGQDELDECRKCFDENGVAGCRKYIEERQSKWKTIPLNVAVIGNSGVGKSSFINAVRDLTADDDGAAAVGVTECTTDIRDYAHPNNPLLKFWDLPGVGTDDFPKEKYLELVHVGRYDFFILMTASRFTENDTWLGDEITKRKKKYLFVRTKLGNDISNDKKAHPKNHREDRVINEIREKTMERLQAHGHESTKLFLIDSYKKLKFDFVELEQTLIRDFPSMKRSAMILSMGAFSEEMIKLKVAELRSRIWKASALSAAVGAIPLPLVSMACDMSMVLHEAVFYYKQLGLDDRSLEQHALLTGTESEKLKAIVRQSLGTAFLTVHGLKAILQEIPEAVTAMAAEEASRYIPIIGSLFASVLSFGGTYLFLKLVLDTEEEVALKVVRYAAEHASIPDDDE